VASDPAARRGSAAVSDPDVVAGGSDPGGEESYGAADLAEEENSSVRRRPRSGTLGGGGWEAWCGLHEAGLRRGAPRRGGCRLRRREGEAVVPAATEGGGGRGSRLRLGEENRVDYLLFFLMIFFLTMIS
jgi:hypothetical protein